MGALALFLLLTGGTAYAVATVGSADVINESLRGVDVKDRSLSGADLGVRVRSAKQVDDGSGAAECGKGPDFDECITVNFTVPRPQRLLLIGSGEWFGSISGNNIGDSGSPSATISRNSGCAASGSRATTRCPSTSR